MKASGAFRQFPYIAPDEQHLSAAGIHLFRSRIPLTGFGVASHLQRHRSVSVDLRVTFQKAEIYFVTSSCLIDGTVRVN